MKIGGRVSNMCLNWFIVEKRPGKTPQGSTKDPWGGPLQFGKKLQWGSVNQRTAGDEVSMPSVDQHLDILDNGPFGSVSESNDKCAARKGGLAVDWSMIRRSWCRLWGPVLLHVLA